jgi:hypothetical protein
METKVTGSRPMASYSKRGQGSSWTVQAAGEKDEEDIINITDYEVLSYLISSSSYSFSLFSPYILLGILFSDKRNITETGLSPKVSVSVEFYWLQQCMIFL